jgi:hypothetical protein
MKNWAKFIGIVGAILAALYFTYSLGETHAKRVTWFSELFQRTQGNPAYLINMMVTCANGKPLGLLQVDLNLTNGKLRIVKNDPGPLPSCEIERPLVQPQPVQPPPPPPVQAPPAPAPATPTPPKAEEPKKK